jgi:hypothetical protein
VVLDAARHHASALPLDWAVAERWEATRSSVESYDDGTGRVALWQVVNEHLHDECERVLVHLRFELGLKSAEVQAHRPDLFPCIGDVYRVTRNVLDRLRRSPALRAWWTEQCA